jgi:hypothetical protein
LKSDIEDYKKDENDEKIIKYNEKIIKYNEKIAKMINIINNKFKEEKNRSNIIGVIEFDKPYCLIDFYTTSGLSTDNNIDRMPPNEVKEIFDYINYDEDKMKLIKSIEIGFNMGLYVKVNDNNDITLSRLYLI